MYRETLQSTRCIFLLAYLLTATHAANAQESNTEKVGDILLILIPATAYGTTFLLDDKNGRTQFYKSFFTNLGVTYGLKLSINKERPDGSDNESFPSLHTSATFQGATFIQKRYGWKYAIPAYIGAIFVAYSRVHADKHYVEDVLAGAAIGFVSSYYFTTPFKEVSVTPIIDNRTYGLTISKKW